jgi:hypothetical protein
MCEKREKRIQSSVGKPEGKRPLPRIKYRCEDNIRIDLKKIPWEILYCIHLVQVRDYFRGVLNKEMNVLAPQKVKNLLSR